MKKVLFKLVISPSRDIVHVMSLYSNPFAVYYVTSRTAHFSLGPHLLPVFFSRLSRSPRSPPRTPAAAAAICRPTNSCTKLGSSVTIIIASRRPRMSLGLLAALIVVLLLGGFGGASPPESRLIKDLMRGYVAQERPVIDSQQPVVVTLGVIMQQIIDLNEKEEQLTVNAWLKYHWNDANLRWNPEQYENVSDIRYPAGSLWQPDVLLYNR
uniref:Neur_chan_LBD domain-containing protein n=1 Tax=Steinernema glaseri TaxID=37863 RepID=A0A1I8A0P7_9BILA